MFGKKSLSTVLYWLFLVVSILLMLFFFYRLISLLSGETLEYSEDGKYVIQMFGDQLIYTQPDDYVKSRRDGIFNIIYLSFYFLIISLIFKNIRLETIFSKRVINILKLFTIFSFFNL